VDAGGMLAQATGGPAQPPVLIMAGAGDIDAMVQPIGEILKRRTS